MTHQRRVVITGLGVVSPIGVGRSDFWHAVRHGKCGITEVPRRITDAISGLKTRVAAPIQAALHDGEEKLPRFERLALMAFREAIADAGFESLTPIRSGIVFGTAIGDTAGMEQSFVGADRGDRIDLSGSTTALFKSMHFHGAAARVARITGCRGPVVVVSTGCTAGIDALGLAFDFVRAGRAEVAVCGAADAPLTPVVFAAFDAIGALSRRADELDRASRPFDRTRDGFVLGEGSGALVLEEMEHAQRRGAPIYAEVTGFCSSSNSYHMTDLPPGGEALAGCFEGAIADAGINADAIDHVNAHGSSTPQNDVCETNCIASVLGDRARQITVNSLKAMVGHALGASNTIELVACALSINDRFVFPTANLRTPDPDCYLDYVPNQGRERRVRHLAKLSNGFAGIHSTAILSEVLR
jgi:3-oxoacyl-(acyl-carrier-protein) synthase